MGADFQVHSYPPATAYAVYLNTNRPFVSDVRVRQALNFAVDREAIDRALFGGECAPSGQPLSEVYVGQGHLTDPQPAYHHDPERARALLAEAGLKDGFDMTVVESAGLSPSKEMTAALQAQFAAIGVRMTVVPVDATQSFADYRKGDYDGFVSSRSMATTGATTLRNAYLTDRFPGPKPAGLEEATARALDPGLANPDREVAMREAATIAVDEAVDVFVCNAPTVVGATAQVVGLDRMAFSYFNHQVDLRYVGVAR